MSKDQNNATKKCKHCQSDIPKKAKICPVCKKKQKNSLFGILVIIISALIIIGAFSGDDSGTDKPVSSTSTESQSPAKEEKNISAEKFNSIEFGMTYENVVSIMGKEGTNVSEVTILDTTTAIYQWEDGLANCNVTFSNNSVTAKAQAGILESPKANVTLAMYDSIKNDMSYNEVVSIFGTDGALMSTAKLLDTETVIYMWDGTTLGGNCNVTFQDGKVVAKAQFGLK